MIIKIGDTITDDTGRTGTISQIGIGTTKSDRIKKSMKSLKIEIELIDWFELLEASVGNRVP